MHEAAGSAEWISLYLSPVACFVLDGVIAAVVFFLTDRFLKARKSPRA